MYHKKREFYLEKKEIGYKNNNTETNKQNENEKNENVDDNKDENNYKNEINYSDNKNRKYVMKRRKDY